MMEAAHHHTSTMAMNVLPAIAGDRDKHVGVSLLIMKTEAKQAQGGK